MSKQTPDTITTPETAVAPVVDAVVEGVVGTMSSAASGSQVPATLQPSAVVSLPTTDQLTEDAADGRVARAKGNGSELTHFETLAILDLYHAKKMTQTQIAKRLNVNQSTVSRTLAKYADTTVLAKKRAAARAEEIINKIIDTGKAKDLVTLLKGTRTADGTRVIEPEREFGGGKSGKSDAPNVYVGVKIENIK